MTTSRAAQRADSAGAPAGGDTPYAVEVRGLVKRYGRMAALRGVDLRVGRGECLTIFGANGSGKTTLIKLLASLSRPTRGSIAIAGRDLARNAPALRRLLGVVTHRPLLYDDLTASENLRFYGRMFGVEDLDARVREVGRLMGIEHRLDQKVRTFSHGMQKRCSIARALLHDPPVLLLDEPETGLDQDARARLERLVLERPEGRTVLLTTHSVERGLALGSRVAVLDRGRVVYDAPRGRVDPDELQARVST